MVLAGSNISRRPGAPGATSRLSERTQYRTWSQWTQARTPDPLMARYGRTGRHLIVRATIGTTTNGNFVHGYIAEVMSRGIHVPIPEANALHRLAGNRDDKQIPRYTVRLKYGAHFEPWVDSIAIKH